MVENSAWLEYRLPLWMKLLRTMRPVIFYGYLPLSRHLRKMNADTSVAGISLHTRDDVFHPRYHLSSRIFVRQLAQLPLRGQKFLDMGTGSGIAAIVAAQQGARVLAVDINPLAVQLARNNAANHGLSNRIRFAESDLFSAIAPAERFDYIAFNPPFFPGTAASPPQSAWLAGRQYETIERFLASAGRYLTTGGRVLIIISSDMPLATIDEFIQRFGYRVIDRHRKRHLFEMFFVLTLAQNDD